jgi:hypothetical protein
MQAFFHCSRAAAAGNRHRVILKLSHPKHSTAHPLHNSICTTGCALCFNLQLAATTSDHDAQHQYVQFRPLGYLPLQQAASLICARASQPPGDPLPPHNRLVQQPCNSFLQAAAADQK